jgi:hypothetical protein
MMSASLSWRAFCANLSSRMPLADVGIVLGIVGAVTGCLGTALSIVTFARDRSNLEVTADYPWPEQELSQIPVQVANHGRQPVAVTAIGTAFRSPPSVLLYWVRRLSRSNRQHAQGWSTREDEFGFPVILDPGHVHRATIEIGAWIGDERERAVAFWACAWDSRGRASRSERVLVTPGHLYHVISRPERLTP